MCVLNGTGMGQYRRIVVPGIGPEKTNPMNRTWILDAPWTLPPDSTSIIQITPYRGRNIFSGDLWSDGGAVQWYGQALDNIVADSTFQRMTGVLAWGQWRGWVPPNRSVTVDDSLQGQMGNGLMPNTRNQYLRNEFVGSWSFPNCKCCRSVMRPADGSPIACIAYSTDPPHTPCADNYTGESTAAFYARRFFAVQPLSDTPVNISASFLLTYRENSGGGGYNLGAGATNIVIDGGSFTLDAGSSSDGGCVLEAKDTSLIFVNNVSCTTVTV